MTGKDTKERVRRLVRNSDMPLPLANAALRSLGAEAIVALCEIAREGRRRNHRIMVASRIALGLSLAVLLLGIQVTPSTERDPYGAYGLMALGLAIVSVVGMLLACIARFPTVWGAGAARLVAQFDDVHGIGALLDSTLLDDYDSPIAVALIRLLPRLRASDSAWFEARHVATLNAALHACLGNRYASGNRAEYAKAVLRALEQVGNESSIPVVEAAAKTLLHPAVRQAAELCLPCLRERARSGEQSLLRAADAPVAELVRPAAANTDVDPARMVRASEE